MGRKGVPCTPLSAVSVSTGWEDALEEGMATCSRILAWRLPWTEGPGGLQSTGLKEETDRAGLHFRPGCKHQATCLVTLPVDSELCARVYRNGLPMGNQTPGMEASGFGLSIA